MLAVKQPFLLGGPAQFLSNPATQTVSSTGFPFESFGEAVYYMKHHQLAANKFKICFVGDLVLP